MRDRRHPPPCVSQVCASCSDHMVCILREFECLQVIFESFKVRDGIFLFAVRTGVRAIGRDKEGFDACQIRFRHQSRETSLICAAHNLAHSPGPLHVPVVFAF